MARLAKQHVCVSAYTLRSIKKGLAEDHDLPVKTWLSRSPEVNPVTFQIVGDNLDIFIAARQMSQSKGNSDIHWFTGYAIKDEVYSSTDNSHPTHDPKDLTVADFLPNKDDKSALQLNFQVLWTRIICESIPALNCLKPAVIRHIPHPHKCEMRKVSEIVSIMLHTYPC